MKKKGKKEKQEAPKQEAPKQEAPKQEASQDILEITEQVKVNELQKQGYIVTEVKSEIRGVRPKTWILKKEE